MCYNRFHDAQGKSFSRQKFFDEEGKRKSHTTFSFCELGKKKIASQKKRISKTKNMNRGSKRLEEARGFIRDHWTLLSDAELCAATNLNITSVRRLRYRMQLIRPTNLKGGMVQKINSEPDTFSGATP